MKQQEVASRLQAIRELLHEGQFLRSFAGPLVSDEHHEQWDMTLYGYRGVVDTRMHVAKHGFGAKAQGLLRFFQTMLGLREDLQFLLDLVTELQDRAPRPRNLEAGMEHEYVGEGIYLRFDDEDPGAPVVATVATPVAHFEDVLQVLRHRGEQGKLAEVSMKLDDGTDVTWQMQKD